jgi:hypothetical protein
MDKGFLDVQGLAQHDLFAAQREHLFDEPGGALDAVVYVVEGFDRFIVQIGIVHQQKGMALDDCEDIVKFVGQSGGQLTRGGQAFLAHDEILTFLQGALGLLAFGNFLLETSGPLVNESENLVVALAQSASPPALRQPPAADDGRCQTERAEPVKCGCLMKNRSDTRAIVIQCKEAKRREENDRHGSAKEADFRATRILVYAPMHCCV